MNKKIEYLQIRDIVKNTEDVYKIIIDIDSSDDYALYVNIYSHDDFQDLEIMVSENIEDCTAYGEEIYTKLTRLIKNNSKIKLTKTL